MITVIPFPAKSLANMCADVTGSKVHHAKNGSYTVSLNQAQLKQWNDEKRKVGVC